MPEKFRQEGRIHSVRPLKIKVSQLQPVLPILTGFDQLVNLFYIQRPPVGRQAHDLILAIVDGKAEIVREGAVEQSQRMGELNLLKYFDAAVFSTTVSSCGPLTHPING